MEFHAEGYACGTLHVLSYLFSIEVLASFVPEAEVGMVAGIRGSCPDGSRLVSSDDVGHSAFWMGVSLDLYDVPVPAIVSMLLGGFFYIFLRNQMIQKENEAQRLQLEKIKNDQLQTELKFLKAQYHPHFLFNVLNTVYFQIDENNEAPRHTLEQLSDLLRYQLYNDGEKVQVRVEVEYLKQYISLCKLRATKRLQLQVHFDEMEAQVEIYPLLFVPLVENAFKYVGGNYFIAMDMCLKEGKLCFSIENSIPEPLVHQKGKHGIGIENLRRRLELLYPERHTLDINRGDTLFRVKLVIEL